MTERQSREGTELYLGREPIDPAVLWDAIVARSPLAVAVVDARSFDVRFANGAFSDVLGMPLDSLFDRPLPELLPEASATRIRTILGRVRRTGTPEQRQRIGYHHPEHGPVHWDCTVWRLPSAPRIVDSLILHVSVVTGEVRERSQLLDLAGQIRAANEQLLLASIRAQELAEQANQHAEQVDGLLTSFTGGVLVLDRRGQVVLLNETGHKVLGYPDEALSAVSADYRQLDLRYLDGTPVPVEQRPFARVLRGERFSNLDLLLVHPDGRRSRIAFNGSALAGHVAEEVTLAILVFYEVTELRRLEDLRADYISLISHDLRSPLTAILGYAELLPLMLGHGGPDEAVHWIRNINEAANRMVAMIEDLVESTRLESGSVVLHREPADLPALVSQVVDLLPSAGDRGRIRLEAAQPLARVSVDWDRLARALTNLISNALKYSPPETPVLVRVAGSPDGFLVSVTDSGPGIPPESVPRLFERFYRVTPGSRVKGIGLGLYISRLIVEAHGGRIWADTELGKGTTFSISLPNG